MPAGPPTPSPSQVLKYGIRAPRIWNAAKWSGLPLEVPKYDVRAPRCQPLHPCVPPLLKSPQQVSEDQPGFQERAPARQEGRPGFQEFHPPMEPLPGTFLPQASADRLVSRLSHFPGLAGALSNQGFQGQSRSSQGLWHQQIHPPREPFQGILCPQASADRSVWLLSHAPAGLLTRRDLQEPQPMDGQQLHPAAPQRTPPPCSALSTPQICGTRATRIVCTRATRICSARAPRICGTRAPRVCTQLPPPFPPPPPFPTLWPVIHRPLPGF